MAAAMIGRRGGQVCYICELVLKLPADGGVSWMIGVPEERAVGSRAKAMVQGCKRSGQLGS